MTMLTLRRGNVEAGLDIAMALRRGTYADMLTLVRGMLEPNRTLVAIAWKADRVLLFSGARTGRPPCSRGHGFKGWRMGVLGTHKRV